MIKLFTASTPNGHKVSVALEEMGLAYTVHPVDLGAEDQKKPSFLELNPNGRIPVIVDTEPDDFAVFESGAILVYLAEKTGKLLPTDVRGRSLVMQWLMFQMGGVGPMMGQANVFFRYTKEKIPYAIERYQREGHRLLSVLDGRLADNEFLAGDYSIADIANFCWARTFYWSGIDISGLDHLTRWLEQLNGREAVQRGLSVPAKMEKLEAADVEDMARKMLV